jgi:beta-lactamase regulating signal transducer with metallopeptidase domain
MSLLELSDRWVIPGLAFLADWSVRWGVLLAMLFCWLAFLPPRRPGARYLLGVVFLASGVLLPAVPRWGRVAISWPSKTPAVVEPAAAPSIVPLESTTTEVMALAADTPPLLPPPIAIDQILTVERPRPFAQPLGPWRWTALAVAGVWALAVFLLACRLIGGLLFLATLRREAREVDEMSRRLLDDGTRAIPHSRRVALAAHSTVGSPLTLGGLRPAILVPADWDSWPEADRRVCLLHELAHLSRRDDCVKLVQEIIRVPFFFHPLVQRLMTRIERERELLCDETVVGVGVDPRAYARLLFDLARRPGRLEPVSCVRSRNMAHVGSDRGARDRHAGQGRNGDPQSGDIHGERRRFRGRTGWQAEPVGRVPGGTGERPGRHAAARRECGRSLRHLPGQ